jgi:16S rRNA processing protein RimM
VPARPDDLVAVGRVVKPHGLRGEVVVAPLTDFPDRFRPGLEVALRDAAGVSRAARLEGVRTHQGRLLIRFAGIDGPEAAEALRDLDVCALPGDVPARPEGFVFHHEVTGCLAVDRDGSRLGTARDLVEVAGRPILVLETPRGEREVPFTRPLVVSVDVAGRTIVLDLPPGLLD